MHETQCHDILITVSHAPGCWTQLHKHGTEYLEHGTESHVQLEITALTRDKAPRAWDSVPCDVGLSSFNMGQSSLGMELSFHGKRQSALGIHVLLDTAVLTLDTVP
jgi:hypothetical protein